MEGSAQAFSPSFKSLCRKGNSTGVNEQDFSLTAKDPHAGALISLGPGCSACLLLCHFHPVKGVLFILKLNHDSHTVVLENQEDVTLQSIQSILQRRHIYRSGILKCMCI